MAEIILFQVHVGEIGYLQRVYIVALCDKVRSCEIRNAMNPYPVVIRIEKS